MTDHAIIIEGVEKSFGGIKALRGFNLRVKKGSIHAIVGENGAGKSTLMKILSGIYIKDKGRVVIHGEEVHFTTPQQSQNKGIGIVHQEFALSPDLSVAENIFLDHLGSRGGIVDRKNLNRRAGELLSSFGFHIAPGALVSTLSVAYQQMVEITKSLAKDVSILILDEPTAVLAGPEIDILFKNLDRLRNRGVTILYISHRLPEIFRIADGITVVKDGETVGDLDPKTCSEDDIITKMVGRELSALYPPKNASQDEVVFEIKNLTRRDVLDDVSLHVRKGEIVGLAGLVGSGRTEIAECVFGISRFQQGTILKAGKPLHINHPADAVRQGVGLVPEDRKAQGAVLDMSIDANITMSKLSSVSVWGVLLHGVERNIANLLWKALHIKLGKLSDPVSSLSGGNQQKVVLAKWLNASCDFLIFDEPTRGVDVGAKAEIYNIINRLAREGCGVLVISSELVELIGLCNRIYVMSEGQVAGEVTDADMTEENIMTLALPKRLAS